MSGLDVQVFVGGKPAQVVYRGRSGCCAGVDQIRIVIPEGVEGCYVPVVVVINGIPSNFTTMSVSSSGSICSDPGGALPGDLEILLSRGELRFGQVALGRTWTEINLPQGELLQRGDTALAAFLTFSLQQTLRAPGEISTLDSCVVTQLSVGSAVEISGLDAGTVTLGGDIGSFDLASLGAGSHLLSFSPDIPNVPGVTGVVNDGTLLTPGDYTFTISGGADVSAATASITLPEPLDWTNRAALDVIDLNAPLVINWTGGTPGSFVQIVGRSPSALGPNGFVGASFVCRADATAGTYTVPNRVLAALPPSMEIGGAPSGNLQVGTQVFSDRFEAPGIDFGLVWFNDAFVKNVSYR